MKTALATLIVAALIPTGSFAAEEYKPDIQKVIPLDVADPTWNLWKQKRDDLRKGREPGLISIQRYPGGMGFNGILTFFRLPVALTLADLKAGDVDVAFTAA